MESSGSAIVELCLERTGDAPFQSTGVICESGSKLRFVLKSHYRLALKNPMLYTNYPADGSSFERGKYRLIRSEPFDGKRDWFVQLDVTVPGTYDYYLMISEEHDTHQCKSGAFLVTAPVQIGKSLRQTGSMCSQTVLSQSLGRLEDWELYFCKLQQLGYNTVHFTPLNELGASKSAYSIRDQLSLSSNFFSSNLTLKEEEKLQKMTEVIKKMEDKYELMGLVDVVWNHTSTDSPWLPDHPEATYNLENSPYLTPAFELDQAFQQLSHDISMGVYESRGLPRYVNNEYHLTLVCQIIENEIFPRLKLWEYFIVNVDRSIKEFEASVASIDRHEPTSIFHGTEVDCLKKEAITRDGWGRFSLKVDTAWAIKLFAPSSMRRVDYSKLSERISDYKDALNKINLPIYEKLNDDMRAVVRNIAERIRYERIAPNGPKKTTISKECPLIEPYFTTITSRNGPVFYAANNGWVWGGNPMQNFAEYPASAYLRRDLIVWADLIKLRYGHSPKDSPWLWEHMSNYTIMNAKLFQGFRIDNCHSTPINVARYLLDKARNIRPQLYVTAELFTGSEKYDNIFIAKLGINSLIREAMQASDAHDLGRIVHKYGGEAIGSLVQRFPPSFYKDTSATLSSDWIVPVKTSSPPAFLFDCTHDNQTPWQKRTAEDYLTNTALVWMGRLPVGSAAGYDWIVSKNPHVDDPRFYPKFDEQTMIGIMEARKFFNELHQRMEAEGFTEIHVHQDGNLITVQRHDPITHRAIFCIVHTSFSLANKYDKTPAAVEIPGEISKYLMCAKLSFDKSETIAFLRRRAKLANASNEEESMSKKEEELDNDDDEEEPIELPPPVDKSDPNLIHGEDSTLLMFDELDYSSVFDVSTVGRGQIERVQRISWKDFGPGSVLVLEASLPSSADDALTQLRQNLKEQINCDGLTKIDANYVLYRCDAEEKASTWGARGTYHLFGYGDLVYAGLQGSVSVLDKIRANNDMGHPLMNNLREGNWLMDYITNRLYNNPSPGNSDAVILIADWLRCQFDLVKQLPRYLIPKYFDLVVMKAYLSIQHRITNIPVESPLGNFVRDCQDPFVHQLASCGIQMVGKLSSVSLIDPKITGDENNFRISMAAGFPHFAQGYLRAWGRDTFISLRGLLLIPGRFAEAREILIAFAGTLRHGLIPNLIDGAWNPRYNARDATWWFLQSLQSYCLSAPEGHSFLLEKCVPRLFPSDDYYVNPGNHIEYVTMASIVQEIMERHANGIHFRERNAGHQIDSQMSDKGFNVDILFDPETGFIYGGNESNCGTWMDKMGSSEHAGNKGIPATPRDGAAIEIIGLLKSTTRWLTAISGSSPTPTSLKRSGSLTRGTSKSFTPSSSPSPSPSISPTNSSSNLLDMALNAADSIELNSKFSAPPAEVPSGPVPANLPPPLFASKKTSPETTEMPSFLFKKQGPSSITVPNLTAMPDVIGGPEIFPWQGVTIRKSDGSETFLSYADWDIKLKNNFEKHFFVPSDAREDAQYRVHRTYVSRRAIYKDTYRSHSKYSDYQLRPNICIAMVVAPEMFVPVHAAQALEQIEKHLLGPLGMRTLDPADSRYRPIYDNSNHSDDFYAANGFSYHMGPEWVWLIGYFLRARMQFRTKSPLSILTGIQRIIQVHREHLASSDWKGLPELTNANGGFCPASCVNQAWSAATLMEALYDLHNYSLNSQK